VSNVKNVARMRIKTSRNYGPTLLHRNCLEQDSSMRSL
jgi:hypothetical protein